MSVVRGRRVVRAVGVAVTAGVLAGTLAGMGGAAAAAAGSPVFGTGTPIATGPNVEDFAVDPATHTAYVPSKSGGRVSFIDLQSGSTTHSVVVGATPNAAAVDPARHTLFVANYQSNSVSVIDTETATVTATIAVGALPQGIAVDPGLHTVYVSNFYDASVSVIDEDTDTVTRTFRPAPSSVAFSRLGDVAVDPISHAVYVTDLGANNAYAIDGVSDVVTATIPVGGYPFGVAVDPSTGRVYTANINGRSVSVIDEASNTVTATIALGSEFAQYVAVDPATHVVYVSGYTFDTTTETFADIVSVVDASASPTITTLTGFGIATGVQVDTTTRTAYVADTSGSSSLIPIVHLPRPTVTALSAHSGPAAGGQQLTITGAGFSGADRVVFGTTRVTSFTVVSDTTITVTTPAHAPGVVQVRVHRAGLSAKTPTSRYTYTS